MTAVCIRRCSAGRLHEFGDVAELESPSRHFLPIRGELSAAVVGALLIGSSENPADLNAKPEKVVFTGLYRTPGRQFFTVTGEEGSTARYRELNEVEAEKMFGRLPQAIPHQAAFCPLRTPGETGYVRWKK
jgi:hypothetical protein